METCNLIKPTRHGKESLGKGIQSKPAKGISGNSKLTCLSGDDTKLGTDHTKAEIYESSNNFSVSSSISGGQMQSDSDLEDDLFSLAEDNEICSDSDDGAYFLTEESLDEVLDASSKSSPCTVVSFQENNSLTYLDPGTAQRSSEVPDPWDKWEDVDLASCCIFDEMPLETCDDEKSSRPIDFVSSSTDEIDYATEFLTGYSTLKQLLSADLPDDCNDANSIWSILTDKLLYCQSDTSGSVRYFSYDSLKAKNAKQRFFDAALNNEPYAKAYLDSCNIEYCDDEDLYRDQLYDAVPIQKKNPNIKTLNTAEATASKNEPIKKLFPQYVENKYEDLEVHTSYEFDPAKSICATYLWTENVGYPKELVTVTTYNTEGYKLWFKQGSFPIGIDGEATAHLLDDTPIPVKTLIDSGASRPILNKHFYDGHPFLHTYPRYKIATRGMVFGNGTVLPCNEAIVIMVKFSGHVFQMICYLLECSKDYGLYIGQKAMYELEGGADFRNLLFHFLMRSLNLCAGETVKIMPGQSKMVPLCIDTNVMKGSSKLREKKLLDIDLDRIENDNVIVNLYKYKKAFSLRDEIGLCQSMEVELKLKDESPFFIRPFPIKESDKDIVDKEMRKGCLLGILKKGMSSYSSPIMLIPRKLTGIPRIVTDFRHLNSRLVTLQPSIPLVRDAMQILGASGYEILSLADLRCIPYT